MKFVKVIFTVTALAATTAQADIYSCEVNGRTVLQSKPCKSEALPTSMQTWEMEPTAEEQAVINRTRAENALIKAKTDKLKAEQAADQAHLDAFNATIERMKESTKKNHEEGEFRRACARARQNHTAVPYGC